MPSEYEIRAEALRAASNIGLTSARGILEAAEKFADWLRDGDWAENAPDAPDVSGFTTVPEETAPDRCTCAHTPGAHTRWDGCTVKYGDIYCGCVWDGKNVAAAPAPDECTCTHPSYLHDRNGCGKRYRADGCGCGGYMGAERVHP